MPRAEAALRCAPALTACEATNVALERRRIEEGEAAAETILRRDVQAREACAEKLAEAAVQTDELLAQQELQAAEAREVVLAQLEAIEEAAANALFVERVAYCSAALVSTGLSVWGLTADEPAETLGWIGVGVSAAAAFECLRRL